MAAGVDHATLLRWLQRGETGHPEGRFHQFYEAVLKAEASPTIRALTAVYRAMPDDPVLAWKFLERTEPGFAKGQRVYDDDEPAPEGPITIHLQLPGQDHLRHEPR